MSSRKLLFLTAFIFSCSMGIPEAEGINVQVGNVRIDTSQRNILPIRRNVVYPQHLKSYSNQVSPRQDTYFRCTNRGNYSRQNYSRQSVYQSSHSHNNRTQQRTVIYQDC